MAAFKVFMHRHCRENPDGEATPHPFYPDSLSDTQLARKQGNGARLYTALGINRGDADARREWIFENFEFFAAPSGVLLFLDANATPYQWLDIGIYLQSTLLLLQEAGLDSCPQADWAIYVEAVKTFLGVPSSLTLVCGIAVGHADSSRPINGVRTDRDDPLALLNPLPET
jgi:nitroreductase